MTDRREWERQRAMIERQKPREKVDGDPHMGDHVVIIAAIASFFFYMGYVYGAQVSPAVGITAAAHAVH